MGAGIPNWFDLDVLRGTVTTGAVLAGLAVILVLSLVRNVMRKVVAVVVLLAAGAGLIFYQTRLDDCEKTCSCRFVLDDIHIDGCPDRPDD